MATLRVLRLIPEPIAVVLLYAELENMGSKSEKIALIFNMSAEFCDVAFTAIATRVFWAMGLTKSTLGGEDTTKHDALPQWICS